MKRSLFLVPWLAAALVARPVPAAARAAPNLDNIQVTYHNGLLLQKVRVITLFWGSAWQSNGLPGYFNSFFRALFLDGRYMANLAQYSTSSYTIANGTFGGSDTDPADPQSTVSDPQIRGEIIAQIAAGKLRKPDVNTLYVVFTPPNTSVIGPQGVESTQNFSGYHFYSYVGGGGPFAYAVIVYDDSQSQPLSMTAPASHELAEAVTDPQVNTGTLGWYDDNNGEIGDIPNELLDAGRIKDTDVYDLLDPGDGNTYVVQKVWSVKDGAPVAFAN